MSLADTLQVEGFNAQMGVCEETFTHLPSGLTLSGVVEVLPPIDPRMELGYDGRELSCLHVVRADYPVVIDKMKQEDRLQQTSQPSKPTWQFVRREDNPADPILRLWIVKLGKRDA